MKEIYLDYSATTPVKQEVLDAMLPYFTQQYGNPSNLYKIGMDNKAAIEKARAQLASLIGAHPQEIYFTSGGSEADNWAIRSVAKMMKGKHIITSKIEHPAVLRTCEDLEKQGYTVTYLDVDRFGFVSPDALEAAITKDTILVSIMMANNEVGTLEPIKDLAEVAARHGVLFHTDAVQALGNTLIDVENLQVDLLSVSGHKIYGPKGVGALYIRRGIDLPPLIFGGGQESHKRAGTENVAGIIGFGKAAELAEAQLESHILNVSRLRDQFIYSLMAEIEDVQLNGPQLLRLPGNANMTFKYVEGEAVLGHLEVNGIYASTGSACSSASGTPSHVLSSMGLSNEDIYSSVRFTVGDLTTEEDIETAVSVIKDAVTQLRSFSILARDKAKEKK